MHPALLGAYAEMLPRIQAAESLRLIEATAIGSGRLDKSHHRRALADLQAQASPGWRRRRAVRPESSQSLAAAATGAGIGLRVVKRRGGAG